MMYLRKSLPLIFGDAIAALRSAASVESDFIDKLGNGAEDDRRGATPHPEVAVHDVSGLGARVRRDDPGSRERPYHNRPILGQNVAWSRERAGAKRHRTRTPRRYNQHEVRGCSAESMQLTRADESERGAALIQPWRRKWQM
jgi:hypothetical protein